MRKLLKGIAILLAAFCIFGCDSPVEEKKDEPKEYEVMDLTNVINYTRLEYNKWGVPYTMLQSEDFEITDLFKGNLPKSGDSLHFTWTGKSDKDISKLYMLIANIDILKLPGEWSRWTHLTPEEKYSIPVATNIKAGEEFTIDVSRKLDYKSEDFDTVHNVHVFLSCALSETKDEEPITLYTTDDIPDLTPPAIKLEGATVTFSKPGKEWLEKRTAKDCNGYILGIASGKNEDDNPIWLVSRTLLLSDEDVFKDVDFSLDLANEEARIQDGKIIAIVDFYKNVKDDEREWLEQFTSSEVNYSADPEMVPVKLELEGASVKVTAPGDKYLTELKKLGCDSYYLGIEAVGDEKELICGTHFHLSDANVFSAYDFKDNDSFKNNLIKIKNNKLAPVIHFYKNDVDKINERVFLFGLRGSEITYTPESD